MEEEDTGRGLVRCSPPNVATTALAWGIYNLLLQRAAAGGGEEEALAGRESESCRWQAGKERLRRW